MIARVVAAAALVGFTTGAAAAAPCASTRDVRAAERARAIICGTPIASVGQITASFGVSAVLYRQASTALAGPSFIMQAAFTLAFVTLFQTFVMVLWMWRRWASPLRCGWKTRGPLGRQESSGMI